MIPKPFICTKAKGFKGKNPRNSPATKTFLKSLERLALAPGQKT